MPLKNSGVGPKAVIKSDRLFQVLDHERDQINQLLDGFKPNLPEDKLVLLDEQLQETKAVFKVWINLYHSLVLLSAAKNVPTTNPVLATIPDVDNRLNCNQGDGESCLKCSYVLPAFSIGDDREAGWFKFLDVDSGSGFEVQNNRCLNDFDNTFDNLKNKTRLFKDAVIRRSELDSGSIDDPPLLQWFLTKLSPLSSTLEHFNPRQCFATCRESVSRIRSTDASDCDDEEQIKDYVDAALFYIQAIWGENIENRLSQVQSWINETKNFNSDEFEDWLGKKFNIPPSPAAVSWAFLHQASTSNDEKTKLVVGGLVAMSNFTKRFLEFTYSRCFDDSGSWPPVSLEELKPDLIENMIDKEKEHWEDLFTVTYMAITWRIFHQTISTLQILKVSIS